MVSEAIRKGILDRLGGKIKRNIKPYDLTVELVEALGCTKEEVSKVIADLKAEDLIHNEIYLAIGKGWKPKNVTPEAVEACKKAIIDRLAGDDFLPTGQLQDELKVAFGVFMEAQKQLKEAGKVKVSRDPQYGWLISNSGNGKKMTQAPYPEPAPTPSSPDPF